MKDDFDANSCLKETLDFPCTRDIHFIKQANSNKLDVIVRMRSNDIIWGASAVNIFNYTFMQEYMAAILGLEIGNYFHFVNNFHYYENYKSNYNYESMINELAKLTISEEYDEPYIYDKTFKNLEEFDNLIKILSFEEEKIRLGKEYSYYKFSDPFFCDWYNVLYLHKKNKKEELTFLHPSLNKLYLK